MSILVSIIVGFHLVGFLSSINAVMSTRTPQGAIAWSIFLITVPYFAVPLYWILGRNKFQGYAQTRKDSTNELSALDREVRIALAKYRATASVNGIDMSDSLATRLTGSPYLNGNSVTLLQNGIDTFDSLLRGISRAREYVLFQFFIVKDDEIGNRFKRQLIAKAREGVRVYFLYDEIGSYDLPKSYLTELRLGGVSAMSFHTQKGPANRFQINFRNHRKIVIIDGTETWIGGHNVGDEYMGLSARFGHWRDTHVHIKGPTVLEAQLSFVQDWYWASNEILQLDWTPTPVESGGVPALIAASGPADELETASLLFTQAINVARRRIWIASPYFIPDEGLMNALLLAGARGVDVRILLPDRSDHLGAFLAAYAFQARASQSGARFFRYKRGFMHQKVLLQDDTLAAVGTANFDNRSFRLNFEITAIVVNEDFAREVEAMLEKDMEDSEEMPANALAGKSFAFRLAVNLARLASPMQ